MNKKNFLFVAMVCVLSLTLTGCSWFKKKQVADAMPSPTRAMATPTPAETPLPPEERPVVDMQVDKQVRRMNFTITNLPEDVDTVEFTVTYQTKGLERGGLGMYEVGKKKEFVFGSASSGVYKYDENVTDIVMTITYKTEGKKVLLRYPYEPSMTGNKAKTPEASMEDQDI